VRLRILAAVIRRARRSRPTTFSWLALCTGALTLVVARSVGKAASDLADTLHIHTPTPRTDAAGAVVDESEDE
jgi:hypothetical protein